MKLLIENKIPFIKGLLEDSAEVTYAAPSEINRSLLLETGAEAIIIRTRTRCDRSLLEGTPVKLVITATIGTDHIDLDYCEANGITVVNAPGCNAPGVAQYVLCSAIALKGNLRGLTIGVIGAGHVGSIVVRWAESLGMKVLVCDPPRARKEGEEGFTTLDNIAREADIITVHTPLTFDGTDATHHLIDAGFLEKCRKKPVIVNSARGPVTDTEALVKARTAGLISCLVIDCWENEPDLSRVLLRLADIATPHIAGYSAEGKQRATRMAVEAFCRYASLPLPAGLPALPDAPAMVSLSDLSESYDPLADSLELKLAPENFENLRNNYIYRHEPSGSPDHTQPSV